MVNKTLTVLIAGGGTGGHLFPALAIGEEIITKSPNTKVHYMGSTFGIEAEVFPHKKFSHTLVPIRGLQRGINLKALGRNLLLPFRLIYSYRKIKKVFQNLNPQVVVGTGGYASALPLTIASRKDIPILIQEQNSYPGITTRWFAEKAEVVCVAFEDAMRYIKKKMLFSPGILYAMEFRKETA